MVPSPAYAPLFTLWFRPLLLGMLLLSQGGCGATAASLRVIHTTDVHGFYTEAPRKKGQTARGGLRRLASHLDRQRARQPGVLLLDSGDMWSGTLLSDQNEGRTGVAAYNILAYDAVALGNHEFDYGSAEPGRVGGAAPFGALRARLSEAKFPVLAANLVDKRTGRLPAWEGLKASVMIARGGFRVGVIGIITPDTPTITFPYVAANLAFDDPVPVVAREASALRARGAELVFVVAHEGGACKATDDPRDLSSCVASGPSFALARALKPGAVDAIFGGHTHRQTAHWVNGVAVIQSGKYSAQVGTLDIWREGGNILKKIHRPQVLDGDETGTLAQTVNALLSASEAGVRQIRSEKLGARLARPLTRDRERASELGTYLCRTMLKVFPTREICLLNSGGMRNDLPAGEITYGDLYDAFPFGNHVAFLDVPGATLLEILRIGTSGAHGVFQMAGLEVEYDRSLDPCPRSDRNGDGIVDGHDRNRLTMARLADGSAIDPQQIYRLMTNNFMAAGGDGLGATLKGLAPTQVQVQYDALPVREALADFWRTHRPAVNSVKNPAMPAPSLRVKGVRSKALCPKFQAPKGGPGGHHAH